MPADPFSIAHFKTLLDEIKLLIYVGHHPNVLTLIGAATKNIHRNELYVCVEYCERGSLDSVLRKMRPRIFENGYISLQPNNPAGFRPDAITLLSYAYQIANGLEYLETRQIIHRDIAARNMLVTRHGVIKISDFGLAKQQAIYQRSELSNTELPIKWTAPEAFRAGRFSSKSDAWSFGVVLWEIFSLGETPYSNWITTPENIECFFRFLAEGERLPKPEYASAYVYDLMLGCWDMIAKDRPSFKNCKVVIEDEFKSISNENFEALILKIKNAAIEYRMLYESMEMGQKRDQGTRL